MFSLKLKGNHVHLITLILDFRHVKFVFAYQTAEMRGRISHWICQSIGSLFHLKYFVVLLSLISVFFIANKDSF